MSSLFTLISFLSRWDMTVSCPVMALAWSEEEAACYLETYKAFDGKDA
jgi:hypothetical protein